jgi:hypothetical protein
MLTNLEKIYETFRYLNWNITDPQNEIALHLHVLFTSEGWKGRMVKEKVKKMLRTYFKIGYDIVNTV